MKDTILDNYALKRLSPPEKILLQKALDGDPNFQQELEFHVEVIKGIESHMEYLFDAALIDVLVYADQDLKNVIQQADIELESEGFFKKSTHKTIPLPVQKELIPQPSSSNTEPLLSEKEKSTMLIDNNIVEEKTTPQPNTIIIKKEEKGVPVSDNSVTPFSSSKLAVLVASCILIVAIIWLLFLNN